MANRILPQTVSSSKVRKEISRAAIYARVSTSNNGQSPEMQLRELREFCERRGSSMPARSRTCGSFRTGAGGHAVGFWNATVRLSDILYLSFVFIDILALFRRNQVEKSRVESRAVTNRHHPTRPLELGAQLLNSSTP
jgi:hypothetical protein